MKIKKAVIPAAGLGTRFLPATKAQPKEMLPIIDKPAIQYIVEEAVASGIEDIAIIISNEKKSIKEHFEQSFELEDILRKKNKLEILEDIQQISQLANIYYIHQIQPKGLGDAVLCAKSFVGNEPFAVLLGDDIVKAKTPCLKQLMSIYDYYDSPVIGVQKVPKEAVHKYGIIKPKEANFGPGVLFVDDLIEKPDYTRAPSQLAIMGRYILKPEIFHILENISVGQGNELQLTDAIQAFNKYQAVLAYQFEGTRYDIGDKFGFLKANIDFSLQRDDLKEEILHYLKSVSSVRNEQT